MERVIGGALCIILIVNWSIHSRKQLGSNSQKALKLNLCFISEIAILVIYPKVIKDRGKDLISMKIFILLFCNKEVEIKWVPIIKRMTKQIIVH